MITKTQNKVYVLGGAQTDFQRNWSKEGKTFLAMMREVTQDALDSTRINSQSISRLKADNKIGIFVGNFAGEQYLNQGHLGAFFSEIDPMFYGIRSARYEAACASGSVALDVASAMIRAGDIDVALVMGIEQMKTVTPSEGGDFLGTAAYYDKEAKGIEYPFPKLFGKLADIIIDRYCLPEKVVLDAFATIATINYSNAKRNPRAQTRSWFMDKTHAMQRDCRFNEVIGGKLAISDCSQVTDGAALVVLASEEYIRSSYSKSDLVNKIPNIKGQGYRVAPLTLDAKLKESSKSRYILPWTRQAVVDAYQMARLNPNDIDVFETHDCFTSSEYIAISAFGLCSPGKEHLFINNNNIGIKGKHPINPSGGLIGAGHPVGATGVRMMLDLYKQVTGTAGAYQINNAKNGLMLNIGGSATTNIVYIVGI